MFIATFFSASSQILLKQSANQTHKNVIFEYLNWRVILSYFIFFAVLLVNTYAYTQVDMKYGAVIDTCTYVFVMILSGVILHESFNKVEAHRKPDHHCGNHCLYTVGHWGRKFLGSVP